MPKSMVLKFCGLFTDTIGVHSRLRRFSPPVLLILGVLLIPRMDCGTSENGRGWGQDAIYPVNSHSISHSLYNAAVDWRTWVPAGGAVVNVFPVPEGVAAGISFSFY